MNLFHFVYTRPLWVIVLCMLAGIALWDGVLRQHVRRNWTVLNLALLALSVLAIMHNTILSRTPGEYAVHPVPFTSLAAARHMPELYREMLMNAFLFFPMGLALASVLPRRWPRWVRVMLTTMAGLLLSAGIEYAQYRFALGVAETDDVICNTLGTLLGACTLPAAHWLEQLRERRLHRMTRMTDTERQFVALTRAAVSGGACVTGEADWSTLFALARQQKLLPILFEYARKTPAAGENAALFAAARQQVITQVLSQTMRTAEFAALYRTLRAAGLHPVVVKGQLCSRLYPLRDHRISADDDLLIPEEELAACHAELLRQGLTTTCPPEDMADADEIPYTKADSPLYIELHRSLFDSSQNAHDDLNRFFRAVEPVEVDGFLALPPHEHLLYLILHAYKHFVGSGIGLRQFCDIGLWAQAYQDEIDWPLLRAQCAEVHAAVFAEAAFAVARDALGITLALPAPWGTSPELEPLLHDTLCGGVYGSNDLTRLHSSTVTQNAVKASRTGERGSALAALFPARRYMERRYPYVKRSALLLPFAWAQRAAGYLRETHDRADSSASDTLRLAQERIELMKYYGVME